jgi:hypothetical protein
MMTIETRRAARKCAVQARGAVVEQATTFLSGLQRTFGADPLVGPDRIKKAEQVLETARRDYSIAVEEAVRFDTEEVDLR